MTITYMFADDYDLENALYKMLCRGSISTAKQCFDAYHTCSNEEQMKVLNAPNPNDRAKRVGAERGTEPDMLDSCQALAPRGKKNRALLSYRLSKSLYISYYLSKFFISKPTPESYKFGQNTLLL